MLDDASIVDLIIHSSLELPSLHRQSTTNPSKPFGSNTGGGYTDPFLAVWTPAVWAPATSALGGSLPL